MSVQGESKTRDQAVLRFEGTFDAEQAWRLRETLSEVDPDGQIMLDFSKVREFQDFAFALLAQDLRSVSEPGRRVKLAVQGLCQHELRVLQYVGVSVGVSGIQSRSVIDSDREMPSSPQSTIDFQ